MKVLPLTKQIEEITIAQNNSTQTREQKCLITLTKI